MNSTSESVVIEDDDDVEIIDVPSGSCGNNTSLVGKGQITGSWGTPDQPLKKPTKPRNKMTNWPLQIYGYTKPSYNFSRLITQALAAVPNRKATALHICDMIAKKHPYYQYLAANWRGSIYSALRSRKKFFTLVGTNENNENIWSFNPMFEQYMLDKWVPKYVQKPWLPKTLPSPKIIQNYIPLLPKNQSQQCNPPASSECSVIVSSASTSQITASSTTTSPVIVFSGTLVSASSSGSSVFDCGSSADPVTNESLEKDPLGPEDTLFDPSPIIHSVSTVEDDFKPWEPEVTVNEGTTNNKTHQPTILAIALQGEKPPYTKSPNPHHDEDFSLDNLNVKHVILKEEILYRVNFNKEHTSIEKFRLHCTVCDDHLGTSGTVCRRKVRLHSVLGVLVCSSCYKMTWNATSPACLWCAKAREVQICCHHCGNKFCQTCLERNFGKSWCTRMMYQRDWMCFCCDTKQIWPHRAIAYFLFRHYRDIRRKKENMSKFKVVTPREIRFFIQDLSTCCKSIATKERQPTSTVTVPSSGTPVASVAPVLSSNFIPSVVADPTLISTSTSPATTSVPSQPPMFVIGEQSPNYIYVQTQSSVPSVTLNTGTQYIHNVYPDKNYVVVDKTIENRPALSLNTSTLADTILYTKPPSTAPIVSVPSKEPTEQNISLVPVDKPPPHYPFPNSPPPPYSAIDVEVIPVQGSSNETIKESASNTSIAAKGDCIASKSVQNNNLNIIVTSTSEIHGIEPDEPIIIPDIDPVEDLKIQEKKVIAVPILTDRERIERRPMPKSKKQSLLRTVLMNESIESMKRHLQLQSEPNISTDNHEVPASSVSPKVRHEGGGQNIEEPILRSIIESATERLLSLQRNQNVSSSTSSGNNTEETGSVATVNSSSNTVIDLCENENSSTQADCKIIDPPITIPKIKIKTLRELQDPEVFNVNHVSQVIQHTDEGDANKESDINQQYKVENQELNKKNVTDEAEINITDLKQGIIEASRTLINTQKQFKELAKIISSNLIYKPDQAVELITKFHDILKACHQELDQIDGNVKQQFGHLIPCTDIESILQLMKKNKEVANPSGGPVILKKRKKRKRSLGKKKSHVTSPQKNVEHNIDSNAGDFEENQTDSLINNIENDETNAESPIKRRRDLVDFNPLGKKVILGSPDITEEDLRRIPNTWDSSSQERLNQNNLPSHNEVYMEELRRRQYFARREAWKRKNIWICKKRKYTRRSLQPNTKGALMYNEDGSLRKKRGRKKRRKIVVTDSDDDNDETYKPTNSHFYPVMRPRRSIELSRPLRLSARMHPSTVAHVAKLMSFEDRDFTHLVKPCSVVLERLDPEMILISQRNVIDVSDSDEMSDISESPSYC